MENSQLNYIDNDHLFSYLKTRDTIIKLLNSEKETKNNYGGDNKLIKSIGYYYFPSNNISFQFKIKDSIYFEEGYDDYYSQYAIHKTEDETYNIKRDDGSIVWSRDICHDEYFENINNYFNQFVSGGDFSYSSDSDCFPNEMYIGDFCDLKYKRKKEKFLKIEHALNPYIYIDDIKCGKLFSPNFNKINEMKFDEINKENNYKIINGDRIKVSIQEFLKEKYFKDLPFIINESKNNKFYLFNIINIESLFTINQQFCETNFNDFPNNKKSNAKMYIPITFDDYSANFINFKNKLEIISQYNNDDEYKTSIFSCIFSIPSNQNSIMIQFNNVGYFGILEIDICLFQSNINKVISDIPIKFRIKDKNGFINDIIKFDIQNKYENLNLDKSSIFFKNIIEIEDFKTTFIKDIIQSVESIISKSPHKISIGIGLHKLYQSKNELKEDDLFLWNSIENHFGNGRIRFANFIYTNTVKFTRSDMGIVKNIFKFKETEKNKRKKEQISFYLNPFLKKHFPIYTKSKIYNEFCFCFSSIIILPFPNNDYGNSILSTKDNECNQNIKQEINKRFSNLLFLKIINYSIETSLKDNNHFNHCKNLHLVCKYWNQNILIKINFSKIIIGKKNNLFNYLKVLDLIKIISNSQTLTNNYKFANINQYSIIYPTLFKIYHGINNNFIIDCDQNYHLSTILFLKKKSLNPKYPFNTMYDEDMIYYCGKDKFSSPILYKESIENEIDRQFLNINCPTSNDIKNSINDYNTLFDNLFNEILLILNNKRYSYNIGLILQYQYPSDNTLNHLKDVDLLLWNYLKGKNNKILLTISSFLCSKTFYGYDDWVDKFEIINGETINQGISLKNKSTTLFIKNPTFHSFTPIHYKYCREKSLKPTRNNKNKKGYENVGCFSAIIISNNNKK
ncbi:hypothetical protein ACTA71_000722 [Dictyostelium dimigraforme]